MQTDTVVLLVPKSLLYLCFNSTAWAMLTGEGLSAVTFLSLDGCESKLSPCRVVCLPTCLICCCQYLLATVTLGSSNSEGLEWGVWCSWKPQGLSATSSFTKVVSLAGVPIIGILDLSRVWRDTVFCLVYFQPLAALISSEQPPTSDLVILLPLISGPVWRNCSEDDEMAC